MKGMKKISMKAGIAAAAVLACIQLAGCGNSSENTTAQKEFVYVPEYQKINNKDSSPDSVNVIGDTIYYLSGEYDESTQKYSSYLYSLKVGETEVSKVLLDFGPEASISRMSADADGNLQAVLTTYVYDEEAPESGGDADTEENNAEEAAVPDEDEADTEAADEDSAEETTSVKVQGNTTIISEASTAKGSFDIEGYREPVSQKNEICKFSTDGTVISTVDISSIFNEQDVYLQNIETDKDGNIYLTSDQLIWVLDKDGRELFKVQVDNWINNMFSTKDGTVMVVYYGQEGMEAHPIDLAKKGVGDAESNMMVSPYGNYVFKKGMDKDLLFSADNILYEYNRGDEAPTEILNWLDCDINSSELLSFAALEDGRILAITSYWENDTNTVEFVYLTKKKGSEVPEKKIMTYATMYLDYEIRKQVISFNKTNQEYRIEVKEYMNGTDDYNAALTQINTDIVSGNTPDIIDLTYGSMPQYIAKGVLEDLYPYMENDPEINREDYLENVLKAYEVDGKLYAAPPSFYINTVLAKVSDVGDRKSITLDELMELMNGLPEDVKIYEYATKNSILMYNTMMNTDQYVDWTTGECKFNGEDFIKALEFANKFDKDFVYDEEAPGTAEQLHSGKLLMIQGSISSMNEYQMYEGMFGEPITFIGYPTNKENGSFISGAGGVLGMSAKSKCKEGVWEFIRAGITKEAQEKFDSNGRWGFPIMKSALELVFESAMKEDYYEDGDGNKVKQPKTSWGYNDFNIEIYAATEEQVEVVRNLIESVDNLYQYNEQLNNIISEETEAFFTGQKTAKEVADIIQSRVQIYVNESM